MLSLLGGFVVAATSGGPADGLHDDVQSARDHFGRWIVDQVDSSSWCRYYRGSDRSDPPSALASAYAVLALTDLDEALARRIGDGLVAVQDSYAGSKFGSGAVPNLLGRQPELFYASDALACANALLNLYRATRETRYLKSAHRFCGFVAAMCDGERVRLLRENVGFPMQYVTSQGDYQNHLVPNVSMLWFDVLDRCADAVNDPGLRTIYERGKAFLIGGVQAPNGAFYDHYDPGYPPGRPSASRWRHYKRTAGHEIGIGDNMMMSAIGAVAMGAHDMATRYLAWLETPPSGGFWAYLDAGTSQPGFNPGAVPYYDVVCSGMYVQLERRLRGVNADDAGRSDRARRFALQAQSADGGFRWGLSSDGSWLHGGEEALVTGYWSVAQ
jgi:hypothetical protein